jgi:PPP family 3-phenylpropionic acid transporter
MNERLSPVPHSEVSTHPLRAQFFLSFAVLGAIVPFISVLLDERGLSKTQIGNVWAIASLGVIFTPLLVTFLADTAIPPRFLMAGLYAIAGGCLVALLPARGYWPIWVCYALHTYALQPAFPLQDGIHFAAQAARRAVGLPEVPYHAVRFMGSIGYLVPATALYFFLRAGESLNAAVWCGIAFCAAGVVNAFLLPHARVTETRAEAEPERDPAAVGGVLNYESRPTRPRVPTAAAARALLEPHALTFCLAMFLIHMASQCYYQFYPLHLTERSGLDKRWVGLIANVGVLAEIPFMLGFAWLVRRITLRRVMYLGALAVGVRLLLLAAFPNPVVAIAVQLLHGPTVLLVHVAPPIFLNARADDRYRNSIQGLYAMVFAGAGKVIGSWASGVAAERSLPWTFAGAGVVCLVAMAMFYFVFAERQSRMFRTAEPTSP